MKKIFAIILLSFPVLLFAQKKTKAIKATEKLGSSITAADLKKHLYIVAGAEMEGRDTPSPGLEKAGKYIEEHFKLSGLKPGNGESYRQYYPVYRDSVIRSSCKINGNNYELLIDYFPGNNYSAEISFSEVVFAGYGIVDDKNNAYKDLDARGKAVIILEGFPDDYIQPQEGFQNPAETNSKINAASQNGVAVVIIISKYFPRLSDEIQSQWSKIKYPAVVNPISFFISENIAAAIMGQDGKGIFDKIKENKEFAKTYKAKIDLAFSKTTITTNVSNVLGLIEGTDKKDEYVIITSHYDHVGSRNDSIIYYGADDDGSGTVSVLELAEAFAKAKTEGKGPRRSILFMTVSGEEHGLWGSEYYSNNPVYPLNKTTANLNIDMIGRIGNDYMKDKDSANYVYIIGDNKLSSDLIPITEAVNSTYSKLKLDRKYNDPADPNRFYYRSDHYNFAEKGVPIIFYFNGVHPDYHMPTDTPDKINYSLMEKRAKLVFFTALEMANREEMLKRDYSLEAQRAF